MELSRDVLSQLDEITSPILLVHSKDDDLTSVRSAKEVYAKVSSLDKELVILQDSYHMVLYDNEKEFVYNKALEFFNKHSRCKEAVAV